MIKRFGAKLQTFRLLTKEHNLLGEENGGKWPQTGKSHVYKAYAYTYNIYVYIYIHYLYVSTIDGRTLVNELGIEKFRFWEYRESLTFMSIASFISHANEPMDSNGEVRTSSPSSPQRSVTEWYKARLQPPKIQLAHWTKWCKVGSWKDVCFCFWILLIGEQLLFFLGKYLVVDVLMRDLETFLLCLMLS